MDIVNPNYLNYMEQIQKNRKDIEELYDQELSDITQLNFKENDENGLDYENGKATFYGKSTIIRDENTQNLEVDSRVELKISSGDDDIVIDAGEDNSTLEIHLDNVTRNKINRALLTPITTPNEKEFVAIDTNNSQVMIPESTFNKHFYAATCSNGVYYEDLINGGINNLLTSDGFTSINNRGITLSDGRLYVSKSGLYKIDVSLSLARTDSSNVGTYINISKNGSGALICRNVYNNITATLSTSGIIEINAGDYINCNIFSDNSNAQGNIFGVQISVVEV